MDIRAGLTDQTVSIAAYTTATGAAVTITSATAGLSLWYRRGGVGAKVAVSPSDLATLETAHADGGLLVIEGAEHRLDLPDAAVAAGVAYVEWGGTATDITIDGGRANLIGQAGSATDQSHLAGGAYKIATTTGNWATAGTWSDGVVPSAGDNIVIRNGVAVTVAANLDLGAFGTLEVQGSGILEIGSGVTVARVSRGWVIWSNEGTVTVNYGTVLFNTGPVSVNYGTIVVNENTIGENNGGGTVLFNTTAVTLNYFGTVFGGTVTTNHGTVFGGVVTNNFANHFFYQTGDVNAKLPANFSDLAIAATTGRVTVGTNEDKSGYGLADDQAVNVTKWGGVAVASANVLIDNGITAEKIATNAMNGKGDWNTTEPPTADAIGTDAAGKVLVTPENKLATDASGNVAANNMRGTDNAMLAASYTAPDNTGIGNIYDIVNHVDHGNAAIRARGDSAWVTATGFSTLTTTDIDNRLPASWPTSWPANWNWSTYAGADTAGTTRLLGLVEDSGGDRFTAKALEQAPSGTGGDASAIAAEVYAAGRVFPASNLANAPTGPQANYTVERATVGSLGHLTVERWQYEALGSFEFDVPAAPTLPVVLVAWQPGRQGTAAFRLSSADGDITVSGTTITIAADDTEMAEATTYRWTLDDATDTAIAEGSIIVKPRPDPIV